MYTFIEVLNTAVEFYLISLYISHLFNASYRNKWIYFAAYFVGFSCLVSVNLFCPNAWLQISITSLTILLIVTFLYYGKWYSRIFSAIIFIVLIFVSETVTMAMMSIFKGTLPNDLLMHAPSRIIAIVLTKIVIFWPIFIVEKFWKKKVRELPGVYWLCIITMPICSFIIVLTIFWLVITHNVEMNILVVFSLLGITYINITTFEFFEIYSNKMELLMLKKLVENQQENYKLIESVHRETRNMRHDLKNHLQVISDLIHKQDMKKATEQIDLLFQKVKISDYVVCTGHSIIDTIFNSKGSLARNLGIQYQIGTRTNVEEGLRISSIDACSIFGNALDNAIEACKRYPGKAYIMVSLVQTEYELICKIVNPITRAEEQRLNTEGFVTTKENKDQHGMGLDSIQETIDRLGGLFDIQAKEEKCTLRFSIPLAR